MQYVFIIIKVNIQVNLFQRVLKRVVSKTTFYHLIWTMISTIQLET